MNDRDPRRSDETPADDRGADPLPTLRTVDIHATSAFVPPSPPAQSSTFIELPGYELVRELGRGAFGVVYFARDKARPDVPLAIKIIEAQGNLDRLMIEPALLSRIRHPGVVRLENYFVHDGRLVLVMEFVPGGDLKTILDLDHRFSAEQVREFLIQIGSALVESHAQQIVHRDLKPSNVLVDSTREPPRYVLVDFGVGRTNEGVQSEKHLGGTFLYMAPEQLRGRPGPQSDLWASGVIAYQMLTGKLPFPGPSLQEVSRQIQYTDPPPPSAVTGQALPGQMEDVILGLLRKSLSERTSTATELLTQLGASAAGEVRTRYADRPSSKALPIAEKWRQSSRRAMTLLIVVLALYIGVNGLLTSVIMLLGLWLFYHAQAEIKGRGRRALVTTASFFVLSMRLCGGMGESYAEAMTFGGLNDRVLSLSFADWVANQTGMAATAVLLGYAGVVMALTIALPVIGGVAYANLRRARREQALIDAALAGQTGSDDFLRMMREMLNTRFEDVGFHLRYAELLYARGDFRDAAVEARLITVQDPYHFNANLLLANCYYDLGLDRECRRVCEAYLNVAGYCFEFQELRDQCSPEDDP